MPENLPVPTKNAESIAKLATGVGTALAAMWFPPAALAQPVIDRLIERYVRKPERILIEMVRENGIEALKDEQVEEFVPMAYKLFEAAKQGEFEHNLRILSEFIVNELKQPIVDAGNFARMARRLEAATENDLLVIALIDRFRNEIMNSPEFMANPSAKYFLDSYELYNSPINSTGLDAWTIRVTLAELASRGLLVVDGAARLDKGEEYYFVTDAFHELMSKSARSMAEMTDTFVSGGDDSPAS